MVLIAEIKNRYDIIVVIKILLGVFVIFLLGGTIAYYLINRFNMNIVASSNYNIQFLDTLFIMACIVFAITVIPWFLYRLYQMKMEGTVYNPSILILYTDGMYLQFKPKVKEFFYWNEIISINTVDKILSQFFRNYIFYDIKYNSKWDISNDSFTKNNNDNGDKLRLMVKESEFELIMKTMNEYKKNMDKVRI